MGVTGLEPVALGDIPPRKYDLLSRVLRQIELGTTPGRQAAGSLEPANDQPSQSFGREP